MRLAYAMISNAPWLGLCTYHDHDSILLAEAQECTKGLQSPIVTNCTDCAFREDNNDVITRIIPDMNFTCSGRVIRWRAAGMVQTQSGGNANKNPALGIWRERSSDPPTYDRVERIKLGRCGALVPGTSNIYECNLAHDDRVRVQPGDIVGIEIPTASDVRFRLYFNINLGAKNYIFNGQVSHISLDQHDDTVIRDQPQISLTVQPTDGGGDSGQPNSGGDTDSQINIAVVAGAVICSIIAILLALVVISLLLFVLKRRRNLKTFSPPSAQSDRATINPVYDGKQRKESLCNVKL